MLNLKLLSLNSLILIFVVNPFAIAPAAVSPTSFDHFSTGFPLDGAHDSVECGSCHKSGVFTGTPTQCSRCHIGGGIAGSSTKPPRHITSSNSCDSCHEDSSWSRVSVVDHSAVFGTCSGCHNGNIATGKTPTHITSGNTCDDCHSTGTWTSARFDHSSVTGSCSTCHNGTTAPTSPASIPVMTVIIILAGHPRIGSIMDLY